MKRILIFAFTFIVSFLLVFSGLQPTKYEVAVGRTAPADIYATREVVDKLTTEKRRAEAEADMQDRYEPSEDLTRKAAETLEEFFAAVSMRRAGGEETGNAIAEHVGIDRCLAMTDEEYSVFLQVVTETQNTLLADGVSDKEESLQKAEEMLHLRLSLQETELGSAILRESLSENMIYSPEKTEEARQKLRDSIEEVTYKANQIIVRQGDIISQAQYEVIAELGMAKAQESGVHFLSVLGIVVLLCAVFGIFYLYFRNFAKEYLENSSILLMVAIIMVLTLLLSSVGIVKNINPYILPLAAGTALLAVLLDVRFALLYNTLMSVLGVLIFKGDAYCLICLLASGAFSAFIFTRGGVRHTLVFSALLQVILCGLLYFGVGVLEGVGNGAALLRGVYGLAAGGLTSVFVIGTLPIWEYAFDVTTPYKLLDLANPEQKLLKRLLIEAPGTYHHSLMVGNLAEAACEATGGNGLLAKIGAYYHDIGKLRRPQYFKENQYAENPHDKITPILSASIIISHVKDGVEMARQNRLPAAICGIIASHHGNSKVAFFYHKATIESEGEVEEAKFHYDGVLPHTKEEAIVMLADSVEAAVRSLSEKTEKEIREMVHKIVQGKLSDGQLMESGLTLQDIDSAENAFVRMFCGYFHSRIQYPEMKDTEKKTE